MPHTLELSRRLTPLECNSIINRLYSYAKEQNRSCCYPLIKPYKGSLNGTEFTAFTDKGIIMHIVKYDNYEYSSYVWYITINPASRRGVNRMLVSSEDEVIESFYILDSLFYNELQIPYNRSYFNINRLDCADNHFFSNAENAELYMSLLKKADIPDEFEIYSEYSSTAHRRIEPKGSIYCWNKSKTVTMNIYIKAIQLQNDRYIDIEYDLTSAEQLLRLEVQCSRQKLSSCKKMLGVDNLSPEAFITDSFNLSILNYYLNKVFRIGDYYTFAHAQEMIINSNFQNTSKELMLLMLELTSKRNGLKLAKKEMLSMGCTMYDISSTLKRFDSLGINPVTIPVKYGVDCILSPVNLLSQ